MNATAVVVKRILSVFECLLCVAALALARGDAVVLIS